MNNNTTHNNKTHGNIQLILIIIIHETTQQKTGKTQQTHLNTNEHTYNTN